MTALQIFLVDDSKSMRERLRAMLGEIAGVELIAEADNEIDALRGINASLPDLVILDIKLKHGSGIEVLRQVAPLRPRVKVAVLTNHGQPQYRTRCLDLGAHCFYDKSKEINAFAQMLNDLAETAAAGDWPCPGT